MITRSRSRAAAATSSTNARSRTRSSVGDRDVATRTSSRRTRTSVTSTDNNSYQRAERVFVEAELARAQFRFNRTRQLMRTERKLVRSCEHVVLLNDKIRGLTKRYKKARDEGFKSFRYNLRIRLAAVEGVRNMFYEYARDKAEEVAELRKELFDQNVHIVAGNDDYNSEEDTYSDMASSSEEFDDEDPLMEDDDEDTN